MSGKLIASFYELLRYEGFIQLHQCTDFGKHLLISEVHELDGVCRAFCHAYPAALTNRWFNLSSTYDITYADKIGEDLRYIKWANPDTGQATSAFTLVDHSHASASSQCIAAENACGPAGSCLCLNHRFIQ